jgi:hypothetical protein
MPVQAELKVQEVITKGIRSQISGTASKESPSLPCLSLLLGVSAGEGQWVTCTFFHLGPSHPDKRTEWQTGNQTALSPVQACKEHTFTCTHSLDPWPPSSERSQSPGQGPQGTSASNGKGCQLQGHPFTLFVLVLVYVWVGEFLRELRCSVWLVSSQWSQDKEMSFCSKVY